MFLFFIVHFVSEGFPGAFSGRSCGCNYDVPLRKNESKVQIGVLPQEGFPWGRKGFGAGGGFAGRSEEVFRNEYLSVAAGVGPEAGAGGEASER